MPLKATSRLPKIRLLPGGHVVIAVTILLGVLAVHSGLNVLHALVAGLLAFQVVAGLRSFLVLKDLEVEAIPRSRVDAGESVPMTVTIRNRKRRLAAVSLEVDLEVTGRGGMEAGPAWIGRIPARGEATVAIPLAGTRRGAVRLVALTVTTSWPCDLFRRLYRYPLDAEALVRPRRVVARPPERPGEEDADGRVRVAARGDGEFRSLREWREGDPPRAIHWRTSARLGKTMVREHESQKPAPWVVVWAPAAAQGDDPAGNSALDEEAEIVAAILRRALAKGRRAELRLAGADRPIPVEGRRGLESALDALARFEPTDASPPRAPCRGQAFLVGARAAPPPGSLAVDRHPFAWRSGNGRARGARP